MSQVSYRPVIDVDTLSGWYGDGRPLRVIDARATAAAQTGGADVHAAWLAGHLPGAVRADLEQDLSDISRKGLGRHPLPMEDHFLHALGQWGIASGTTVVVYDAAEGSMAAARLWWLLRTVGHQDVHVLDGGLAAWQGAGKRLDAGEVACATLPDYPGRYDPSAWWDAADIDQRRGQPPGWLVDVRAPARFDGINEPIDPVAGHVPGAVNLPFAALVEAGRLRTPEQIRQVFAEACGWPDPSEVVAMCGSGVTACYLLLALEHAGLRGARLFAGSWSGWISDGTRPIARKV